MSFEVVGSIIVQQPPLGKFSYSDLEWESPLGADCEVAFIPFDRLDDFVAGESERGETTFYQTNVQRNSSLAKPRFDSFKWCAR